LGHDIGTLSGTDRLAGKRLEKQEVFSGLFQGGKDLEGAFTERLQRASAEDPLQWLVPTGPLSRALKQPMREAGERALPLALSLTFFAREPR
jgi:hypothetical protein